MGTSAGQNLVTLHLDGNVCVMDGLNLTRKQQLMSNDNARFFMDIAVSPPNANDNDMGYVLIALMNDLCIKQVRLGTCRRETGVFALCRIGTWMSALAVLVVAVAVGWVVS